MSWLKDLIQWVADAPCTDGPRTIAGVLIGMSWIIPFLLSQDGALAELFPGRKRQNRSGERRFGISVLRERIAKLRRADWLGPDRKSVV